MPEKVESIMRRIHVMFAKCEVYQNSPDKIILSKREMFDLLQELNDSIYEVLDQYEASTRSKEKARMEIERQSSDILANARNGAEQIQAASLIFSDTMLNEVRLIAEGVEQKVREEYEQFQEKMQNFTKQLVDNKEELKTQLSELREKEVYLSLLNEKKSLLEKEKIEPRQPVMKIMDAVKPELEELEELPEILPPEEMVLELEEPEKEELISEEEVLPEDLELVEEHEKLFQKMFQEEEEDEEFEQVEPVERKEENLEPIGDISTKKTKKIFFRRKK